MLIDKKDRYCSKHIKIKCEEDKAYYRAYDEERKDSAEYKFYKTDEWLFTREDVLVTYKGLDLYEYFINKEIVFANVVHHIEELKENWDKRVDLDNLIPVSQNTHLKIHSIYKKGKEEKEILQIKLKEILLKAKNSSIYK